MSTIALFYAYVIVITDYFESPIDINIKKEQPQKNPKEAANQEDYQYGESGRVPKSYIKYFGKGK